MGALTDPHDNIIYEMHQYLDSDGSGTHSTCVSTTISQQRLVAATNWCRSNKKNCIIGETAAGSNSVCLSAIEGMLSYMKANNDVWRGWLLWGGGPWWGWVYPAYNVPYLSSTDRPQILSFLLTLHSEITCSRSSHRAEPNTRVSFHRYLNIFKWSNPVFYFQSLIWVRKTRWDSSWQRKFWLLPLIITALCVQKVWSNFVSCQNNLTTQILTTSISSLTRKNECSQIWSNLRARAILENFVLI